MFFAFWAVDYQTAFVVVFGTVMPCIVAKEWRQSGSLRDNALYVPNIIDPQPQTIITFLRPCSHYTR